MREFWIKVLNYIISILVKDIFEQINFFLLLAWVSSPDGPTLIQS